VVEVSSSGTSAHECQDMEHVRAPPAEPFSILHLFARILRTLRAMVDQSKYYITGAFILGATVAVLYQNSSFAPDRGDAKSDQLLKQQQKLIARFAKINDLDTLKKSLVEIESNLEKGSGNIKQGIEGCIGDTPLIKIKSLSEATGCEILAKAEVWNAFSRRCAEVTLSTVFERGW
jgi:hypothetical protein